MKHFPPPQEKESLSLLESECTYSSEAHINTNKDDVHQQDRKNRAVAGEITQFHVVTYADDCPLLTLEETQHPGAFRGHTW